MRDIKRRPRLLAQLIGASRSPQGTLYRRAGELLKWQRLLEREMAPEFTGQWRLARLDDQAVVLYAHSPAWATRLRYVGALIRQTVAAHGGPKQPKLTVRVTTPPARQPTPPGKSLSDDAGNVLKAAAQSTDDERLASALRRLSRHAGRKKGNSD